jgi:hypothetical protein
MMACVSRLPLNWLHVCYHVNAGLLPHNAGQARETLAVPVEQCVARTESECDAMRMIPACCACVLERRMFGLDMHLLLIFQSVEPMRKTCN